MALELADTRIALVDNDPLTVDLVRNKLQEINIKEIVGFHSLEDVWQSLCSEHFDAVVSEWRLSDGLGLTLLNRVRRHPDLSMLPFIAVTHEVRRMDFSILSEYPCSGLVYKPFSHEEFGKCFHLLWEEFESYSEQEDLIAELLQSIRYEAQNVEKFF